MEQDESKITALANSIEHTVNNPEEAAQHIQKKLGNPLRVIGIIQDFIKSYDAKEGAVSDETWLALQFAKPEYADAFKGENGEDECHAAAKGIVQGVENYENAKKSLCLHIDRQNGSLESWLALQIDTGAKNNNMDTAEYAAQISEGLDEAIEENVQFILDDKDDNNASAFNPADRTGTSWELLNKLQLISDLSIALPPMQVEPDMQQAGAELFENEPVEAERKAAWYERAAARLKRWTYPIAGGLEIARRLGLLPPPLNLINYNTLGAKVRNGIDNIVTLINVAAGKVPVTAGYEEYRRNITAHLGEVAVAAYTHLKGALNLPEHPVKAAAKMAFGKAGSAIAYIAQQAVAAIVPPAIRTAIRTTGNALASAGRSVAGFFTGRR